VEMDFGGVGGHVIVPVVHGDESYHYLSASESDRVNISSFLVVVVVPAIYIDSYAVVVEMHDFVDDVPAFG